MDCINAKRGGGPKTPLYEGKGRENPGVVALFAVAGCRGNLRRGGPIRYDVVASYYFLLYDMGGRRLSSWSCYCSPIDGARCRASLLSRFFALLPAWFLRCRRIFPLCFLALLRSKSCSSSTTAERQNTRKIFAEWVRGLPGESHGHSVFAFFLRARFVRKNVPFSEFLVSHTTSRRRLPQTLSYSSAHSSASPSPVRTSFLRRREQIA